jgi:starch synthase (maltosyl-transferring)
MSATADAHRHCTCPHVFALFQKRIEGDDALMELARLRFRDAGLCPEFYAESIAELEWLLRFMPSATSPLMVHLPREVSLFEKTGRKLVIDFARYLKGKAAGIVVHDQREIPSRFDEYIAVLREMDDRLGKGAASPALFIEYAAGLDPEMYMKIFRSLPQARLVSACIDIGHLGLNRASRLYGQKHEGRDIFALRYDAPALPGLMGDLQEALVAARGEVLRVIRELGGLGKRLHLHLHDAHPLTVSPFGVSDHLSFLDKIPLSFEYRGKTEVDPMFGPAGLVRVVREALQQAGPEHVTFSFEIHPAEGRLPLGNVSNLFHHWTDKGNAERMNAWLAVLVQHHRFLLNALRTAEKGPPHGRDMIIYNLFPLLAGRFPEWEKHFLRAAEMGFNWIFINPIQKTGRSGSIYSISDYFSFNPLLVDISPGRPPEEQVREMIKSAGDMGLRVMVDLVINHCSVDAEIIRSHPEWFVWERKGRVAHPFADENGKKVVWKDLAKFDHRNTADKEGLFLFFLKIIDFLAGLGFRGFRCDAAYQLPRSLWERLIRETRKKYPDVLFFAETLGCPPDLTRKTAAAGFDYIFNSAKWWDFRSHWLMEQYALTRDIAPSISFPESHDTERLCEELKGNIDGLRQRYLFSALFSAGVMMPMGFEYGFRKRLHVVKTRPEDWEETGIDLTSFISDVNRLKTEHAIFSEDPPMELLHNGNPNVLLIWKASAHTREECLVILNKDVYQRQHFHTESLQKYLQARAPLMDISPDGRMEFIPSPFSYDLGPGQGIVLITSRDYPPED